MLLDLLVFPSLIQGFKDTKIQGIACECAKFKQFCWNLSDCDQFYLERQVESCLAMIVSFCSRYLRSDCPIFGKGEEGELGACAKPERRLIRMVSGTLKWIEMGKATSLT